MLTGHPPYDGVAEEGGDGQMADLVASIEAEGGRARYVPLDLGEISAPRDLVARTVAELGPLEVLVAAHAHSSPTPLGSLSADEVDRHLVVNVRATLLLAEAFAAAFNSPGGGRLVLFTSGQALGPMPGELAYAASKAGVEALVLSLADALAGDGVTVNAVNPGPTDTGRPRGTDYEAIRACFPAGRWGQPEDAARLVAWLVSPEASWVTGQVLNSEGGFRRG
jgi:3-oxoacyl-[acyl-carrier protein] reductase